MTLRIPASVAFVAISSACGGDVATSPAGPPPVIVSGGAAGASGTAGGAGTAGASGSALAPCAPPANGTCEAGCLLFEGTEYVVANQCFSEDVPFACSRTGGTDLVVTCVISPDGTVYIIESGGPPDGYRECTAQENPRFKGWPACAK